MASRKPPRGTDPQQLDSLARELDALWDHTISLRLQFDLLLRAIERADFRMRGFNPIIDAIDLVYRDLLAKHDKQGADLDARGLEQTRLLLHACEQLRRTLRMD